jgi:hypothetical protein
VLGWALQARFGWLVPKRVQHDQVVEALAILEIFGQQKPARGVLGGCDDQTVPQ